MSFRQGPVPARTTGTSLPERRTQASKRNPLAVQLQEVIHKANSPTIPTACKSRLRFCADTSPSSAIIYGQPTPTIDKRELNRVKVFRQFKPCRPSPGPTGARVGLSISSVIFPSHGQNFLPPDQLIPTLKSPENPHPGRPCLRPLQIFFGFSVSERRPGINNIRPNRKKCYCVTALARFAIALPLCGRSVLCLPATNQPREPAAASRRGSPPLLS